MMARKRIILVFAWLAFANHADALNFGKVKIYNYARVASPEPAKNVTIPKPPTQRPVVKQATSRKFQGPFTRIYPLTFTQNKKKVNLTVLPIPLPPEEAQSRIMNNPQPYPLFTYETDKPDKPVPEVPPTEMEEFDDSPKTSFSRIANRPAEEEPLHLYKGLDFVSFQQQLRKNKTKPTPVNFHQPPLAFVTNPKVPKPYPPPLQVYNKATVVAAPPPPPYENQQQWASCICVPYFLCKNNVINSGGRLQASHINLSWNKTRSSFPSPSKIVNVRRFPREDVCEPGKVCCQIDLSENTADEEDDENYYPVATPAPSYPFPPRFPVQEKQNKVCGTRPVYGVQTRLTHLQYTKDVAEFGEYPWQVAVLKKNVGDKNLYLCGGVLIKPQWVATVGHCIKRDQSSPLTIRLGEWDVNRKDEVYPYVEKDVNLIVIHPDFNPESLENDLALIKMKDPVDSRLPHIIPACIPEPAQIYEGQECWVSGWGKDFFGPQGEYQNVLKEVDVPVVSRALCNAELRSTNLGPKFVLHPGFLCAGGDAGKDACTGDGGSPLVCRSEGQWYVVGLVSWGIGCGQPGIPGVYVNVLYYVDWINSVTKR